MCVCVHVFVGARIYLVTKYLRIGKARGFHDVTFKCFTAIHYSQTFVLQRVDRVGYKLHSGPRQTKVWLLNLRP